MSLYSKKILINNIEYLIKKNEIKIGDLENEVNVSTGYFSRLKSNENDNVSPSIEVMCALSEKFNVSLDTLLFNDYSCLTETELYVLKFLKKLVNDTKNNLLDWSKISLEEFYGKRKHNHINSMLSKTYTDVNGIDYFMYKSLFVQIPLKVSNSIYKLSRYKRDIYLIPVEEVRDSNLKVNFKIKTGYELYFLEKKDVYTLHKICNGMSDSPKKAILDSIKYLYESIEINYNNLKLDKTSLKGIEEFMNGVDDDEDDIPF